jgi:hypothetical protein
MTCVPQDARIGLRNVRRTPGVRGDRSRAASEHHVTDTQYIVKVNASTDVRP